MARKPYKLTVLSANRPERTRSGHGLLHALRRHKAAPTPSEPVAPAPAAGAPEIRISLPKPPPRDEDPPAAPEVEPGPDPADELLFEEADTEELCLEEADTEELLDPPPTPGPQRARGLHCAARQAELEKLELLLDEYLDGGGEHPEAPRLGMDDKWWEWFEALEREGHYSFGLSEQWLRWFDSLDRAA